MNVTIITSGQFTITQATNGKNQGKVQVGGSGGYLQRHPTSKPYSRSRTGRSSSLSGHGDAALEILDYSKYQQRFPHMATTDNAYAAKGFCVLKRNPNGTYYCERGTCTGSCTLYNFPVRCSCS